jgi:hypothetical protein
MNRADMELTGHNMRLNTLWLTGDLKYRVSRRRYCLISPPSSSIQHRYEWFCNFAG